MNWNKFFTGVAENVDDRDEDETETEDEEEATDSNATVSTDKRSNFFGIRFHRFPHQHLSVRCITTVFLIVNAATFLAGIVGIVISVWSLTDDRIMSRLIGQRFLLTILLLVGVIASLVSFLGIIALVRKRRKLLNVYVLCYILFLCGIFISAILSFWIFDRIMRNIQDDMVATIETYQSSLPSREAWDNTHAYLKCCGVKSSEDWATYQLDIPKSCCARRIEQCIQMTEAVAFKSGCLRSAVLLLKSQLQAINLSALLIFLITLLSFILALCILGRTRVSSNRS
ncbi:tetraspanin-4 isoform X2 [Andrena cerasifolii]|uniref:tetraspanin-4 isoform X2 n=1 Tax=Andrena cerasifolii TaxID=2819439 RepID=UPI0040378A33